MSHDTEKGNATERETAYLDAMLIVVEEVFVEDVTMAAFAVDARPREDHDAGAQRAGTTWLIEYGAGHGIRVCQSPAGQCPGLREAGDVLPLALPAH